MFKGIPRGVIARDGETLTLEDQSMPMAAFMQPERIKGSTGMQFTGQEIFLGVADGKTERRTARDGRPEYHVLEGSPVGIRDDRHMATVASSRSGKGREILIPTLLSYEGSLTANDPKGELANITARYRSEVLGQDVAVADPFEITKGFAATKRRSFNPMKILQYDAKAEDDPKRTSPTLVEDGGLIADALVMQATDNKDPHWDDSARNLIEGVIIHVATCVKYEGRRNLVTVRDLLMGRAENAGKRGMTVLKKEMELNDALDGIVQDAAEDFFGKPKEERGSVLSTTRRHIRFLSYKSMRKVLSGGAGEELDLADLKRRKMTLYLVLPAMRMGTCARWLRVFVNLTLALFERDPVRPNPPVLMCLDEFPVLGHMKTIEDAAGQIAGFGVRLWVILQDLGQLKALYKERWQTFMGNAGVLQFFGNNDEFTLQWLEKRLGITSLIVRNKAEVADKDQVQTDRRGSSWSVQTKPLMTLEENSRFFGRDDELQRQLVIWAGYDPIILQRVKYDSHDLFAGRFDDV